MLYLFIYFLTLTEIGLHTGANKGKIWRPPDVSAVRTPACCGFSGRVS